MLDTGVSAAGNPLVVVSDTSAGTPRTRVLEWTANSWALVGGELAQASQASLAVGPGGSTYIAFTASDAAQRLRVSQLVGGQWQAVNATGLPDAAATTLTLQAAGSGVLYLACNLLDEATGDPTSTVLKLSGGTWQALPGLVFDPTTPMRLSSAGAPLVLGLDANSDTCLMALSGGVWQAQGPCAFTAASGAASIAISPSGALLVAYTTWEQGDSRAVRLNGASWDQVGGVMSPAGTDAACQLVAASDAVLVSACATSGGQSLQLYNGTAATPQWSPLSMTGLPAQAGQLRLAVTSSGTLFAAYSDPGSGGAAASRQYAQQ